MGALDGGIAAVFGAAFSGIYLPGEVFHATTAKASGGKLTKTFGEPAPCRYQPEKTTQAMRQTEGYTDKDARFFILRAGVAPTPALDVDDEFQTSTGRWQVIAAGGDPASSYWDVHARPARTPPVG